MESWPSARHDQAQWLGTDKARAVCGRKKEAFGCHALLLQVRREWAWYKTLFGFKGWASKEICWRCKVDCGDILWTDTSTTAAWRTSRYRTSELLPCHTEQGISVNPLFSLHGFSAEVICIDVLHSTGLGTTQDAAGNMFFDLVAGQAGTQVVFNFLYVCLRLCLCVWVCSSIFRVHVQLFFVSIADPGFFRAQARSGWIAELWNTIKLHYKTFHMQSRLQKLAWEMIASTRSLPSCVRRVRRPTSLTVRGLFEQLFGLSMTMSVVPFDSAACARCSRQFCNLYKVLSKEASDDKLWKLKPKMHMVQEMCEVQSALVVNPREFWTYRDESFMGVVSSKAHSRGGLATASTIPIRVLDTHRALSR